MFEIFFFQLINFIWRIITLQYCNTFDIWKNKKIPTPVVFDPISTSAKELSKALQVTRTLEIVVSKMSDPPVKLSQVPSRSI